MKRVDLVRHIEAHGCTLLRQGGRHSINVNPADNKVTAVPRHREINDYLASQRQPAGIG